MIGSCVARGLAVVAVATTFTILPATAANASCVPPEVTVAPTSAAPGQHVTLTGRAWLGICNDTGRKIDVTDRAVVTFVQGSRHQELGRTNSNAEGVFSITVRVPVQAVPGRAVLEVRGRAAFDDVPLTITAGSLPRTGGSERLGLLAMAALGGSLVRRLVRAAH